MMSKYKLLIVVCQAQYFPKRVSSTSFRGPRPSCFNDLLVAAKLHYMEAFENGALTLQYQHSARSAGDGGEEKMSEFFGASRKRGGAQNALSLIYVTGDRDKGPLITEAL